ncbi:hypothetical protein SAMN05216345_103602 [Cupriavidus sp. YR651]|uniref:alpha/beta hydrolase n=1 Tax=Cupriavidus sp. YR651 TaxID=1855315 RepID=UPI00088FDDF4|nr:alpha/beta hydrolase [Cupriavidus sp. YR651]SDC76259.1 hypothetical protein SAMN05216345_103602 [Cupriavidus sp. YR651]
MPSTPSPVTSRSGTRWLAGAAGVAGLALAAGFGRMLIFRAMERDAFVTCPLGELTAEALGVPSRQYTFASGDRELHACFVAAPDPHAPALAVFHGDQECLSDWAPVQAMLHAAGITSFVFDYSGYGASTGRPSVRNLQQDALAAYTQFVAATPDACRHHVMGFSLGSGILLDIAGRLQPPPDGAIIGAGFRSARAAAVATGRVPRWLAWMLPDPWNNAARIRKLSLPVLLIHSRADATIPFSHGEHLARMARGPSRLEIFEDLPHNAAIDPPHIPAFWAPVIAYLRTDRLT